MFCIVVWKYQDKFWLSQHKIMDEYNEEKMEVKISGDFHCKESTHSKYNLTALICAVNENHFFRIVTRPFKKIQVRSRLKK